MIDPALTDDRAPPSPDEGAVRLPTYAARARRLREESGGCGGGESSEGGGGAAASVQDASGEVAVALGGLIYFIISNSTLSTQ